MAGVRGVRNPMPMKGGKPTGIFSTKGSQKKDPIGGEYRPDLLAKALDMPRKGPGKNSRGKK